MAPVVDSSDAVRRDPAKPQRGAFRPQAGFKEFYFDETGDTNATSLENAIGGWTGVFKLRQKDPSADSGTLSLFYNGDAAHAGFDNVTFISRDQISFVEDAGATLHGQRNALDSGFVLNVKTNYANPANQPIRWLAQGRDASATLDAANAGFGTNEDDNEITGILVSNGDPDPDAALLAPRAASSVAPVASGYEHSLRPCLGTTSTPRGRAAFRQALPSPRAAGPGGRA